MDIVAILNRIAAGTANESDATDLAGVLIVDLESEPEGKQALHWLASRDQRITRREAAREVFVKYYCTGKQYDSCVESPCTYASHSGCQHPLRPRNL